MHPQHLGEHCETRVLDVTLNMMIVIMKKYKTFHGSIPKWMLTSLPTEHCISKKCGGVEYFSQKLRERLVQQGVPVASSEKLLQELEYRMVQLGRD